MSQQTPLIALVDDDEDSRALFARYMALDGARVVEFDSGPAFLDALDRVLPDAVLLDMEMPELHGLEVLKRFKGKHPHIPVVVLSDREAVPTVVSAMSEGAFNYLLKRDARQRVVSTVNNALESGRAAHEIAHLARQNHDTGLVGTSATMKALFRRLDRVAATEVTVLVHGESGTGKELVSRAIHERSERARGPFVALNCAAIPESLQESTLFGHERGAFTGAERTRVGCFEEADGGTLFLDEVGELSAPLQAKLLRAIQERSFRRVGGSKDIRSDFRIVAATHRDLLDEVELGRFRQDLYFRIAVFELEVPPLRDRGDDVIALARRFMAEGGGIHPGTPALSRGAIDLLRVYHWPGNVRELQNAIRHALVDTTTDMIDAEHFPRRIRRALGTAPPTATSVPKEQAPTYPRSLADDASVRPITALEEDAIRRAIDETGGNLSEACRRLGMGRTTLYRKMRKYAISAAR